MRWRVIGCMILATAGVYLLLGVLPREATAGTTPPVNLSGSGSYARFPTISRAADGTLCAAWTDNRDGAWNIYSSCSVNNGQSWSDPGRAYSSTQESLHPAMLFSGTVPVLAWTDNDSQDVFTIYQKTGASIVAAVPSINQPVPRPSMALASDGTLHLVFAEWRSLNNRVSDVRYTRRPVGGDWLAATVIFASPQLGSMDPRIAIGPSGVLHVVWRESGLAGDEIRYMTGTVGPGGVAWSPSVTASNIVSLTWQPDVAITSNGDVHIVWTEKLGNDRYLAYTRFRALGGRTPPQRLGGPFPVNQNNPYHLATVVDAMGTRVCAAWNAVPEGESAEDVFLICSKNGGDTWSPPENLSRTRAMSIRPSIAVAPDGSVHVVWQEFVGTNYDYQYWVYYTRWLPYSVHLPVVMRNAQQ